MINSIGLPNKGLDGYLAHDLPQLAELPVPLIVNVMGSSAPDVARLVAAFGERDEVAALELNVSCPNVKTGLLMGADPGETAALLDAVRPSDRKAADREAHPELRIAGGGRGGGGAARRRCRLADQHAARHGDGPAPARRAVARRRDRRRVRPGGAGDRAGAGPRGARAGPDPDRRHGRRADGRARARPARCRRRSRRASARNRSATPSPAPGSPPSWHRSAQTAAMFPGAPNPARPRIAERN